MEGFAESAAHGLGQERDDDCAPDFGDHACEHGAAGSGAGQFLGGAIPVRLQANEHNSLVGLTGGPPVEGDSGEKDASFRIVRGDFFRLTDVLVGGFAGGSFRGDDDGHNDAFVFLREKFLRDQAIQEDRQGQNGGAETKPEPFVPKSGIEATGIKPVKFLQPQFKPAGVSGELGRCGPQKVSPKGGTQGEGDKGGDGHGTSQGDGKLPEENSRGAGLEGDRKKDHHQAGGDSQNRPGDLLHGEQTGLERRHSILDVTNNVFQDYDRVIDHDPDSQDEGQQCEDVDAIAEHIEKSESAEDRDGDGGGWNDG